MVADKRKNGRSKILRGLEEIGKYIVSDEQPMSPKLLRLLIANEGFPAKKIIGDGNGSTWFSHEDNVDDWFRKYTK